MIKELIKWNHNSVDQNI